MTELHGALDKLAPLTFSEVPTTDLETFLRGLLSAGELICNSVPPPPGGDDFHSSRPAHAEPDTASSAKDVAASAARFPETHPSHADLQKSWGKPYKFSAKDNPLDVQVYKMAAHDRHGAWFARRSVHEGISFTKMKRAMQTEFVKSLATEGGPGAGAVRGIGVDRRIEKLQAGKTGQVEVYQLSAQFPGPTTPREFVTLLMTSEDALTTRSAPDGQHIPRHYMIMSRPVKHPEAGERSGYILGKYESVELIREVPLHTSTRSASTSNLLQHNEAHDHATGRDRGSTISYAESRGKQAKGIDAADLNPVEWIMVTRSDPGGGIPRFMVERGTPSSIIADVGKFFDWACSSDEVSNADTVEAGEALERQRSAPTANGDVTAPAPAAESAIHAPSQVINAPPGDTNQEGYLDGAKRVIGAGIDAYAPTQVAEWLRPVSPRPDVVEDDDSSSDSSYESADDYLTAGHMSAESLPITESLPSAQSSPELGKLTGIQEHDKELKKLDEHKQKLDQKMDKTREADIRKLAALHATSATDQEKAKQKVERDMKKNEEKHKREVEKLEAKRLKELEKAQKKRQKQLDRDTVSRVTRERDDFRRRIEMIQRENELLREQIGDVQKENTALINKLSKLAGGDLALQTIRDEISSSRKRAT
ncbi:hypothetical protein ANO11243_027880 [Dothideomycetidae sp. 11243]|nr:hypothetical protein ANO11243_027880 [fungal sp. No.11243]